MDPGRRELFADWEQTSRLAAAKFRADSAEHLGDPSFEELIQALRQSSPEFCKAWKRHEVARVRRGPQGAAPPGGRHADVRARGVPAGRGFPSSA